MEATFVEPSRVKVAEFMKRWLEDVAGPKIRKSTYAQYEGIIRIHINPRIGGMPLRRLTAIHIQNLYASMERDGISGRTRQLVHARLFTALKKAVRWRLIPYNPCLDVDRPSAKTKEFSVLTSEQVSAFFDAAKGTRLEALYVLAVTTGLRQGELLGLQWENVDLDAGVLFVRHQLQEVRGKMELTEPKTKSAKRRVALPKIAVDALVAHRTKLAEKEKLKDYVFPGQKGGPMRKSSLRRKSFEPLLEKAKLPHIRFHDLRHTAATLLLCEDVHPKVVQERLGHSRIGITLDTYSHVSRSRQLPFRFEAASSIRNGVGASSTVRLKALHTSA